MSLATRWHSYIDTQHRQPRGLVGRLIGERMRRQHTPETDWTVALLGIQPADRVLELGFGVGRGLELALAAGEQVQVTGVDLSPDMLRAAARRNHAAFGVGRLALLRGDLTTLPFGPAQFDRIFSIHTFYFWRDPAAVCRRLTDMLAPGGRLMTTFATARQQPDGIWEYWDIHRRAEQLAEACDRLPGASARLERGPNSRKFNNIALVVDKD